MSGADVWPTEIRLKQDRRSLLVRFSDGAEFDLPAEYLRVLSPSAEVQGHSPEQRQTVAGKVDVTIAAVDPVGNYAVRLTFSDRHDSGIFSWPYLRKLGMERNALWTEYLRDLEAKDLSRAPAARS